MEKFETGDSSEDACSPPLPTSLKNVQDNFDRLMISIFSALLEKEKLLKFETNAFRNDPRAQGELIAQNDSFCKFKSKQIIDQYRICESSIHSLIAIDRGRTSQLEELQELQTKHQQLRRNCLELEQELSSIANKIDDQLEKEFEGEIP